MISLAGLAVAIFALIHDAVRYNNWLPGIFYYEFGGVGVMIQVLFQMIAMVLGTLRQLANARQNAKIAWMNAEISK